MNLRQKTISGLTWSFIDNFAKLGITFIVGIILARLLAPCEFGLVGMITIFIAISQSFIDSGFTQALIRKQNCNQTDYSTVFFFNLAVGIFFYFTLYFCAPSISKFFKEPQLKLVVQVLGLGLIINALTLVQRTKLTKDINFKLQTKISIIATAFSGIIGILMAFRGYGVWSLVIKTILGFFFTSILLWFLNRWQPSLIFSSKSFKELFSFGSKLLVGGLIYTSFKNIYLLIIGKFFSAAELGYYTRAEQFSTFPSQNITSIIQRVTYPVLSTIQEDKDKLKSVYKKLIKSTMLFTFVVIIGIVAVAKPLVITLIGIKWLPSVVYLQLLCFVGIFFPWHELNVNLLKVQGRSDLILKLESIEKILAVPIIIFGIYFGIKILIVGMILHSIVALYINSTWSGKYINYTFLQQVKDIAPSSLLSIIIGGIIFIIGHLLSIAYIWQLSIQIITGIILFISFSEITKMEDYLYVKVILSDRLKTLYNPRKKTIISL